MGFLRWLFGKKEPIPKKTVEHSSKGEYVNNGMRLANGGHGQEAIEYMKKNNIDYNVVITCKNGVRLGNVPNHKESFKRKAVNQAWFPEDWSRKKIKHAGQVAARGKKMANANINAAGYDNVNVGIKRTDGTISSIFPTYEQKKGAIEYEYSKIKRTDRKGKNDIHAVEYEVTEEISRILCEDLGETMAFLDSCTEDEFLWVGSAFDDISTKYRSQEFIDCITKNKASFPNIDESINVDIEWAKKVLNEN